MKIAIICAIEEEITATLHKLNLNAVVTKENYSTTGVYGKHELTLTLCGIGKVNAAIHTQKLISEIKPDYIINVGIAGNLAPHLDFGDVVIATDLVHHDMDVTGFGIPLGQIPRMDVFSFSCDQNLVTHAIGITPPDFKLEIGRIASGDQFINDKNKASFIYNEFNALACEMEGVAVAQACHINKIPFLVIRALSDKAGAEEHGSVHSYKELEVMASNRAAFVIKELLERF